MSAKTNNKYQKQTAIKMIKKLIFALVIGASNSALAQVSMVKMQSLREQICLMVQLL